MDNPIPVDLGRIAQDLQIRRIQVESVVQLLDEGNTVPFITRYRKERTGGLNEVVIREIQVRVGRLRDLAERKETILKTIESQGKLTDDLAAAIRSAENPKRLEDLYLPYKAKKKTKASEARDKGLEPLALRIWNRDETLLDLAQAASEFIDAEKGLDTNETILEGVGHILAEAISELANVRESVRRVVWKTGKIVTTKSEIPEGEGLEYRDYFAYSEPVSHIPPHRILAINRGDKEGPLKVRLDVARPDVEHAVFDGLPLDGHPQAETFRSAALDAIDRLLLPSMEREVRRDLTEAAERHAVEVFARNLRSLLLQPPIPKQVVLAIDPGLKSGCKVAVLDGHGALLEHGVIHPHAPQNRRHEAKLYLKELVGKHRVGVVAIGNGTACRETEELVAEIISEGTHFHLNPGAADLTPEPAASAIVGPDPETTPVADPPTGPVEESGPPESTDAPGSGPAEQHVPPDVEELPPLSGGAPEGDDDDDPSRPGREGIREEPLEEQGFEKDRPEPPATPPAEPTEPSQSPEPSASTTEGGFDTPASAARGEEVAPIIEPVTERPPGDDPSLVDESTPSASNGTETDPRGARSAPPEGPGKGGGGRPPRAKGEPRPPRPRTPPPPPQPHPADAQLAQLAYVIVNEAGASVYSTSNVGREEFPDFDAILRGTVSIGRRLQDPLSELVKIEPQNIGVGLYQHDVNPKQLKESLDGVISSCVNFVGVDLNTASVPLLRHVSGLNQLTARRIADRRREKGPFARREELAEIEGIGPVTYTQAAGFLKIPGGADPFDKTWVHPESYPAARLVLEKLGFDGSIIDQRERLPELHARMNEADLPALAAELNLGEPTLHDIFESLARPDRDPREDLPRPIFKKGILKLEDLVAGMELKGTVLNVVDFGAFIDIGLKDSGLVHISQLANRYIKSPHDVVSVGDVVTAWVIGVDNDRKRVSLTMVKPGTERPRPERGQGGGGGNRRGPAGPQGDRRPNAPRPPRQAGTSPSPQLLAPPTGAAPGGASGGGGGGQGPGQGVSMGDRRPDRPPPDRPGSRIPTPGAASRGGQGRGPRPGGGRPGGFGGSGSGGGGRRQDDRSPAPSIPVPPKPVKPSTPPPPLSKDALTGSVPLRSFGQLKQLWQARTDDPTEGDPTQPPPPEPGGPPDPPPPSE